METEFYIYSNHIGRTGIGLVEIYNYREGNGRSDQLFYSF